MLGARSHKKYPSPSIALVAPLPRQHLEISRPFCVASIDLFLTPFSSSPSFLPSLPCSSRPPSLHPARLPSLPPVLPPSLPSSLTPFFPSAAPPSDADQTMLFDEEDASLLKKWIVKRLEDMYLPSRLGPWATLLICRAKSQDLTPTLTSWPITCLPCSATSRAARTCRSCASISSKTSCESVCAFTPHADRDVDPPI